MGMKIIDRAAVTGNKSGGAQTTAPSANLQEGKRVIVDKQSTVQRIGNTVSGAVKQTAASWGDSAATAYEAGQKHRDNQNDFFLKEYQRQYDDAKRDYRFMLEDNEAQPGAWSQSEIQTALNRMSAAKTKLDAMGFVVDNNVQEKATETARDTMYQVAQSGAEDIEKAKEGLGAVGRFVVDAGAAGLQLAGDAAANYLLFGGLKTPSGKLRPASTLGAKLSMGGRVFGGSAMQARQDGASLGEQIGYGAAQTVLELGLEQLGGLDSVYGKGATSDFTGKLISKLTQSPAGQKVLKVLSSAGGEGAEEFLSGVLSPALQSMYDGKSVKSHYSLDTLKDAAYEALIGGVLGAGGGTIEVIGGGYQPSDPLTAALFGKPTQQTAQETTQEAPPNAAGERTAIPTGEDTTQAEKPAQGTQTQDALMAAMFGQDTENAASGVGDGKEHHGKILDTVRGALDQIKGMASVAKLTGTEFQKSPDDTRSLRTKVIDFFNSLGNKVVNPELGEIELNDAGARDSTGHGYGPLKAATFAALPDVLTKGKIIAANGPHTGHDYDSFIISAPVEVNGVTCYVGALVIKDRTQRYKLHEVLTTNENGTPLFKSEAAGETDGPLRSDAPLGEPEGSLGVSIPQSTATVNTSPDGVQAIGPSGTPVATQEGGHTNTVGAAEGSLPQGVGAAEAGFMFGVQEEKFGVQEGGEKAVRPDDMPKMVAGPDQDGNMIAENVSRTAVTVKGAEVTPDDFVPLLQGAVMDTETPSGLRYMPITNDETAQKAMDAIMGEGWTSALANWTAKVRNGQNSPVETAIGALLYNHAVNSGDAGLALDILSDYATNVRNAAQSLQAARILKTMTPDNRLYMIRRSLSRMMADGKMPENITIGQELEAEYLNAQSEQERDAVLTKIQESVAAQWPGTWLEKWTALRYVNMLGNFKTQERNLLGNVGMWTMRKVHNAVGTGLEHIAHMASGGKFERTRSLTVPRALSKAAKADFDNVKAIAMGEQKYGDLNAETNEFMRGVQDKREIFRLGNDPVSKLLALPGKIPVAGKAYSAALRGVGTAAEGYRKATNWAMNNRWFGDEGFSKAAYGRALAGWLKAHGITAEQFSDPQWQADNAKTVDKGRQFAVKEAQEATYRDSNTLSEWVSRIGRRSDTPKAVKMAAEGLSPFRKTPANVLVRAEEYSPLGLVNTAVQAFRAANPDSEITGADIINSLSKSLTGTGLFLAGMALRAKGLLRGGPEDDEEQAAFDDLTGHQDYSLELPDGTSITLDWASPLSMPLFMGVQLEDLRQDKNVTLKDLEQALTSLAEPMLEMSMMQGISDTLDDLRYSESYNLFQLAGAAALSYLTQGLTNSLVSHISQSTREESLMTYVDKESPVPAWLQRELGAASRKWPGEGYNQVPYIDAWGREEETGDPIERSVRNLFSPAYLSKVEVDKVEQELQRLYDKTGEGGVLPDRAEKSFEVDGETKQLTADEYVKYAKAKGQNSYKFVQQAVNSAAYKSMSNSQKAEFVSAMYSYANYKAKKTVAPKYENETYAKYAEAERAGMSPAEYFLMDKNIDADGSNKQGTPTQAEAKTYLDGQTKLNQGQKADLWDLIQRTDAWAKANPYRK